jgi:hypothetical protein
MFEDSTLNLSLNEEYADQQGQNGKRRRKPGRPKDEIWKFYRTNPNTNDATCVYCPKYWGNGRPGEMEAHLANICPSVPENIKEYWQKMLANKVINYKRTNNTKDSNLRQLDQLNTNQHKILPIYEQNEIDKAVLKAWIATGIPFEVIDNPFMIDLFKQLNSAYNPPGRMTLSNRLLEQETARINLKINAELEKCNYLTLALDGWSSPNGNLLYNYVISTTNHQEYLIALKDYSKISQTGIFMANEIEKIIENIGLDKFAGVVTDGASNLRVARQIIHEKFPHILNIRCAAHSLNLIATDLVKISYIKTFISQGNEMIKFFSISHRANAMLKEGLTKLQIKGGELKMYIKTRWCSLWNMTDSILRARPIFNWVIFFILI